MVKSESGVTLVELIIALAIAGLLATSVLFGRDQLLSKQQFSQGVDAMVEALTNARNQAVSTVGQASGGNSCNSSCAYIYAKTVRMSCSAYGHVLISTEVISQINPPPQPMTILSAVADQYTVNIPWGVAPDFGGPSCTALNTNFDLMFAVQDGGDITTYWSASPDPDQLPTAWNTDKNGTLTPITTVRNIPIVDNRGNSATITIDKYGDVSRVIN